MAQYHPNPDVLSTEIDDDESVLLSLDTQGYYALNDTGSRIWQLLSSGHDAEAIASAITEEWRTTHEEALDHVQTFLQELNEEGLVVEKGDETG